MPEGEKHVFLLQVADEPDALARVLAPLAVVQARLDLVEYRAEGGGGAVRLEARGLDADTAALLLRRLERTPVVRSAGLGWKSAD